MVRKQTQRTNLLQNPIYNKKIEISGIKELKL